MLRRPAVLLAIGLLVLSEHAYRDTTATMRRAVELSEARITSVRLLQLLNDAEAAHFGYLVTGQPQYLARHAEAKAELAQVQPAITAYLVSQGAEGAAAAQWVADFTQRELAHFDRTLALAQAGKRAEAAELTRTDRRDIGMQALRAEMSARLAQTNMRLQRARDDMLDELLVNRLGVGLLTLGTLFLLFLFARQLGRYGKRAGEPAELLASLERINEHLTQGIALKRRIIEDLRPSALTNLGLTAALDVLCREMSASLAVPVRFSAAEFKMSPEASLAVYRFVQEALTNIGKYAAATHVEVELAVVGGKVTVEVRDDGVGFVVQESYAGHHGLSGMQFRAETLGGEMSVTSHPGHGTTVRIGFPQGPM